MKRVLCPELPRPGRAVVLPDSEAEHLTRVLRLRDGDVIEALDGRGQAARVVLRTHGGRTRIEATEDGAAGGPRLAIARRPFALELSVLKAEAMEWVVEKAVELGVQRLNPWLTAHTVVQMRANKPPEAFQQRWQKIADQALKQCGRLERMEVGLPRPFEMLLSDGDGNIPLLWCDETGREAAPSLLSWGLEAASANVGARLLIGPEGGWSVAERGLLERACEGEGRAAGLPPVSRISLGPLVLRAETAAVYGMSLLSALSAR